MNNKEYYVYILTNQKHTTLYTGITNNLTRRVWEHKEKIQPGFTNRYNVDQLMYFETLQDPHEAIKREKQIKNLVRRKKIALIERYNLQWLDLYNAL